MPTFTVLVPHYSEKILLSLREIIREEDQLSRVTLLEYLKQLHPVEWDCFVKDTKVLAEETAAFNGSTFDKDEKDNVKNKIDDLPFYCIGFSPPLQNIPSPYSYLGISTFANSLPHCLRFHELSSCNQTPLSRRKP